MIRQPPGTSTKRTLHPAEMVVPYAQIGDRFNDVVRCWFERHEALSTTVSLLFGTLYTGGLPWEFQFLALTQALETFHRRTSEGVFVADEQYQAVEDALIAAIPNSVPADLRQSLKARIIYGNEVSQRRRFRELLTSLDPEAQELVASGPGFVDRVVDQRNYLTHYPADEASPMAPVELFYASHRLRAFLVLLLLAEIGITGTEAADGVRRLLVPRLRWCIDALAAGTLTTPPGGHWAAARAKGSHERLPTAMQPQTNGRDQAARLPERGPVRPPSRVLVDGSPTGWPQEENPTYG